MKKILALLILGAVLSTTASASYENYIDAARSDGVVVGDENGDFNEEKIASRAEFAVMLTKFLNLSGGINMFSDVKGHDWFAPALSAANHHGLLMGDQNNMARPYDPISREDAITILGRYYKATGGACRNPEAVSDYAEKYWAYAEENNLLLFTAPKDAVSKGEILKLLYDYDAAAGESVRFSTGYPRLSHTGEFGKISIDIKTNVPCSIYYKISEVGVAPPADELLLCRTEAKKVITTTIPANISKVYNVYLRAESYGGVSKNIALDEVQPFSIAIGSGTAGDPYIIFTPLQLSQISLVDNAHYRLGGDIILDSDRSPIEGFSGTLDGNGYKITIEDNGDSCEGVFGTIDHATIKNLTVDGSIRTGKNGGIIAKINDGGTIDGCVVTGLVEVKTDSAGGICGQNLGVIKNCLSAAYSVAAGSFAGGICGQNLGIIENCLSATEVVASEMYAGGISGTNDGGTIKNSVGANMTVYDSLTTHSGKLTTNRKNAVTQNNYCYDGIISNALYEEPSQHSQNGFDVSWNALSGEDFYKELGWDMQLWSHKNTGFRLISPKNTAEIVLIPGKTMYFPKSIASEQELREIEENSAGHYALAKDITLSMPWKTLCINGFSGTLDGNGHSVYNLNLKGEPGMFSNITGGTIKNLTLRNVTASPTSAGAILTACNYGYIENCNIFGRLESKKTGYLGVIAGENHGAITNCQVYTDIYNTNPNATIGGICAENDGNIIGCMYRGKITATSENAIIGGICGYDTGGNILECYAEPTISLGGGSGYAGGICGIMTGTQAYKCATGGNITASTSGTSYTGGICALSQSAVLYNSLSTTNLRTEADSGYTGGICGFASEANVQNTYSTGTIIAASQVAAGGICGFAENGFIMQNVALNPAINGGVSIGSIVGDADLCAIYDNYYSEKLLINGTHLQGSNISGTAKTLAALRSMDFYTRPLVSGGQLGWDADTWKPGTGGYAFPHLSGVFGMERLTMPKYK